MRAKGKEAREEAVAIHRVRKDEGFRKVMF